jgi:hypothetical protein
MLAMANQIHVGPSYRSIDSRTHVLEVPYLPLSQLASPKLKTLDDGINPRNLRESTERIGNREKLQGIFNLAQFLFNRSC